MILEVEVFNSLEELANDIADAANSHQDNVFSKDLPMKIEVKKDEYTKIEEALKSRASYDGLRNESELMSNVWNMGDIYVSFILKKKNEAI
jgi:hypothetical protein